VKIGVGEVNGPNAWAQPDTLNQINYLLTLRRFSFQVIKPGSGLALAQGRLERPAERPTRGR
jgi:hypothetical protein